KYVPRRFIRESNERYLLLPMRHVDLLVNKRIVKMNGRRLFLGVGVEYTRRARPVDSAEAHGAGLAGSEDLAIVQLEGLQPPAGVADSDHFRMRGGVVQLQHLVPSLSHHFLSFYDDRTERPAITGHHAAFGQSHGHRHEFL